MKYKSIHTIQNFDDDCLKTIKNIFYGIMPVIIVFIGLLTNNLALVIYLRKKFRQNNIYIYFCSLTISENLNLLDYLREFIDYKFNMILFSCQLTEYISFVPACISSWIYVFISFDRMLNIVYTNSKLNHILNKKISKILSLVLLSLPIMLAYLPILVINNREDDKNELLFNPEVPIEKLCQNEPYMVVLFWINMLLSVVFPSLFMFIFSTCTILRIIKSRCRILKLKCCKKDGHEKSNLLNIKINRRDKIFAITSFSLNFLFLILNLPKVVLYLIYYSNRDQLETSNMYFVPIVDMIFFLSSLQLFFTSFITNSIFRKEFFSLISFCAKYSKKVSSTTN